MVWGFETTCFTAWGTAFDPCPAMAAMVLCLFHSRFSLALKGPGSLKVRDGTRLGNCGVFWGFETTRFTTWVKDGAQPLTPALPLQQR